jgi:amino acid adenylation domain-containing protein
MLSLHEGVSIQAEARPDASAVVWRGQRTTYAELETTTNRLARLLIESGCGRGDRVAILMPKMTTAITAMLGVLKTGAAYVPLEPKDPALRLARILRSADCRWILCAGPVADALNEILALAKPEREPLIGWLEDDVPPTSPPTAFWMPDLKVFSAGPIALPSRSDDLAHLLFTSGSTGMPKGVMITHESVAHFVSWARKYFGITSDDRISNHSPLRFDVSTFDVFGTLWSGAELHLVPPELNLLPHKLADFIRGAGLTQWFSVPAALNLIAKFDALHASDFPELKRVLFAGEVLPTSTLMYWMRRLPHARFTNLYGPTETTISSSYFTIPHCPTDPREPIPLGRACDGEELLVLDERLQPCADDQVGDLYIRGVGVSPGYWRDPDRTHTAFLQDLTGNTGRRIYKTGDRARRDARGLLYFCGRGDTQIKSRGYRIELGEIEAALNALNEISEGAVVAIDSCSFETTLICCAYAPARGAAISPTEVKARLAAILPRYMLPARWKEYDVLPRNGNGKVDRPLLKEAFARSELVGKGAYITALRSSAAYPPAELPAADPR